MTLPLSTTLHTTKFHLAPHGQDEKSFIVSHMLFWTICSSDDKKLYSPLSVKLSYFVCLLSYLNPMAPGLKNCLGVQKGKAEIAIWRGMKNVFVQGHSTPSKT